MYACISPFYDYFTIFLRVFIISYPHPETKGICSNYIDRVLSSHKRDNKSLISLLESRHRFSSLL